MANPKTNTYKHRDTRETLGAYEDSALDAVLAADAAWSPDRSSVEEIAPKTEKVGRGADYSKLDVEELRQIAAQRGIDDAETLNKRQAIKAIEDAERAAEDQP